MIEESDDINYYSYGLPKSQRNSSPIPLTKGQVDASLEWSSLLRNANQLD